MPLEAYPSAREIAVDRAEIEAADFALAQAFGIGPAWNVTQRPAGGGLNPTAQPQDLGTRSVLWAYEETWSVGGTLAPVDGWGYVAEAAMGIHVGMQIALAIDPARKFSVVSANYQDAGTVPGSAITLLLTLSHDTSVQPVFTLATGYVTGRLQVVL
jgi:hypothetical protein